LQIISRDDARAKGLVLFYTGIACRRGHICERYVSGYTCVMCTKLPLYKEKVKAHDKKNKEHRRAYLRKWKVENRDRVNELGCLWAKRNPEKHAMRARLRRARVLGIEGSHTVEEVLELFAKQKFKCASCFIRLHDEYEVDHNIPVTKPGSTNWITNIQILCVSCNRRKNAKDPIRWAQENGRLL
jgi:5-methylcytosine-specific restriction endonuclease McrA